MDVNSNIGDLETEIKDLNVLVKTAPESERIAIRQQIAAARNQLTALYQSMNPSGKYFSQNFSVINFYIMYNLLRSTL